MSEKLKYPVLLVHGMGFRDGKYINYWGRIPAKLEENGCKVYYGNQDSNGTVVTTSAAEEFNCNNPDEPEVHYQSYAFVMKHVWSDLFMLVPGIVVKFLEGPNDGLLAPRAVMWTNFRGIVTSNSNRGISHCDEVDMRRRKLSNKQGEGIRDITDFYIGIINELRDMGF